MEIRKVQMTGGSSYVVTLPKEWIKSNNIIKNDSLGLINKSDGSLLITTNIMEKKIQRIKEFFVNEKTSDSFLLRQLIGAYIAGYTSIRLQAEHRMPLKVRSGVRTFTQITIGQEVVEESDRTILIKDLLKPAEMPFNSTIKRMHLIVKSMHEDTVKALETGNKKIVEEVLLRDNDVDRLHWLVARQYNIILRNIDLTEKIDITLSLATTYFLISRIIERMGDHVVRIAKNVQNLIDDELNRKTKEKIQSASDIALNIFNKSIGSFFRKDIVFSDKNIESVQKLEVLCEEINSYATKQNGSVALAIGYISESIRRIGEYAEDLSETAINYLVGEEN